jgi:hypothetical protein
MKRISELNNITKKYLAQSKEDALKNSEILVKSREFVKEAAENGRLTPMK